MCLKIKIEVILKWIAVLLARQVKQIVYVTLLSHPNVYIMIFEIYVRLGVTTT
jgi:hypothetical protein